MNLNNISTLMNIYPEYAIGFSDHTLGTIVPLAAVVLGACVIEKHFTLDKEMEGWDHKISATKDEMKSIVEGCKRIVNVMGSFRISANESDEKKKEFRRSVVITRFMTKGEIIALDDIDYKRPGGNIDPEMTSFIVGRTVNKDIVSDHILTVQDII